MNLFGYHLSTLCVCAVSNKNVSAKNMEIWTALGSENRDRGGIQWKSEPTSPPGPLLKINTNYAGFSGLSNA